MVDSEAVGESKMSRKFYRFQGANGVNQDDEVIVLELSNICGYLKGNGNIWIFTKQGPQFQVKEIPPEVMIDVFGESPELVK